MKRLKRRVSILSVSCYSSHDNRDTVPSTLPLIAFSYQLERRLNLLWDFSTPILKGHCRVRPIWRSSPTFEFHHLFVQRYTHTLVIYTIIDISASTLSYLRPHNINIQLPGKDPLFILYTSTDNRFYRLSAIRLVDRGGN